MLINQFLGYLFGLEHAGRADQVKITSVSLNFKIKVTMHPQSYPVLVYEAVARGG